MQKWFKQKFSQLWNRTFFVVAIVSILEISGDSALAWTSPVLPVLSSNDTSANPLGRPITERESSWIGSLLTIGALLGALPYVALSERCGRKIALLLSAVPSVLAYLTLAFSTDIRCYYASRLLLGIGVGAKCSLIPVYVVEIAEDSNRGMLTAACNIFANFGELLSYSLGPFLTLMQFNVVLAIVPFTFLVLFQVFAPETPYFLLRKNQRRKAEKALELLRNKNDEKVKREIEHIEYSLTANGDAKGKLSDLFNFKSRTTLKALGLVFMITISEQMSGLNAYVFYAEEILKEVYPEGSSYIYPIIMGLVLFGSSFIAPICVESLGRRILLINSFFGMAIANIVLGTYFYLRTNHYHLIDSADFIPITSMVVYIIAMNIGIGPLMWTVACELFPPNLQSPALCIVSTISWLMSFFVTNFFAKIVHEIGKGQTFLLFASFCVACLVCIFLYLPETKGKSFPEIQSDLKSGNKK